MSYALQTESMTPKEYEKFVKELPVEPGVKVSHGTEALLALIGGARNAR